MPLRRNPMKLRRNEYCPIHHSRSCCGRKQTHKAHRLRLGVQRIEDPHHPRGYRELRSPSEMRKLLNRKVREQDGKCVICHKGFRITATSCRNTRTQKPWEELGEMIIADGQTVRFPSIELMDPCFAAVAVGEKCACARIKSACNWNVRKSASLGCPERLLRGDL